MFHVNAWGIPFATVSLGTKLSIPGPKFNGQMLAELIEKEKVTITAGVPTDLDRTGESAGKREI